MSIYLEIISPEKTVVSQEVDMAVLPALEGDIAAMEGHVPMILLLRGGLIELYKEDKVIDRLFVESGFAEIREARCTVLAKEVKKPEALSAEEGYKQLSILESKYGETLSGTDAEQQRTLIDEMRDVNSMIELATSTKHHQL